MTDEARHSERLHVSTVAEHRISYGRGAIFTVTTPAGSKPIRLPPIYGDKSIHIEEAEVLIQSLTKAIEIAKGNAAT